MFKKLFSTILAVTLAIVTIFGVFRFMPGIMNIVWFVIFVAVWAARKLIRENLISYLQNLHNPTIDHYLWITDSSEVDEDGKGKFKRIQNTHTLNFIRYGVDVLILAILLGLPLLVYSIISGVMGFIGSIIDAIGTIFSDLAFTNGVGFFIGAIFEILVTVGAIIFIVYTLVRRTSRIVPIGSRTVDVNKWMIVGAILIQRIVSWFYFTYTSAEVVSEILSVAVIVAAVLLILRFKHQIGTFFRNIINKICRIGTGTP